MTAATIRPVFASARPLLLDTDIGTDIDDVYALICAAISPEFILKAVTTVNNDVVLRARIARQRFEPDGADGCTRNCRHRAEPDSGRTSRLGRL